MRLSLRFVVPLLVVLSIVAYAIVPVVDRLTVRWLTGDLDIRASLIANTVQYPVADLVRAGNRQRVVQYFTRITQDERLHAVGYCSPNDGRLLATSSMPSTITCDSLARFGNAAGQMVKSAEGSLHVSVKPLDVDSVGTGSLILVHDMSFVERRSEETRLYLFYLFVGLGVLISLITVVIAQLSWRGWEQGVRALFRGEGLLRPAKTGAAMTPFAPIATDLRALIRDIDAEHQARSHEQMTWGSDALRAVLHGELRGQEAIVVANREPYIHVRDAGGIAVQRPASGLVTALEPIMRACSGTWIAHGSGSADREVVDSRDHVAVPPDQPAYEIRRLWLTREEEAGYYYGFANEGLWPLCHNAHVRPAFRSDDWEQYRKVNQRFARAVADEATSPDPIVLVQDYHFALVPRMIRELLPSATIITFWHIPWPNPEAFAVCPWRQELLDGLLGSSILGFHTQDHCNNFVDTVDRLLEARVDRETFTVSYRAAPTAVKRYPISIEWPVDPSFVATPVEVCRQNVLARHALPFGHRIGVGIDRLDYTKGIEERLRAVERLMELHPEWVGRFSFIQIGAPTRSSIDEYQHYEARVRALVTRINDRFTRDGVPAVILRIEHHEPVQVYEYYRGADLCMVSSLHDGMNLVAKEFVAARDDERGVLILSQFTGAARELPEAIIVNPYDTDQCAQALQAALTMPAAEQRARMRLMRGLIQEFNVYRWAGRMLLDAAGMRSRRRLLQRSLVPDRGRRRTDPPQSVAAS
jgi:trehalose 6-phosphate synthase